MKYCEFCGTKLDSKSECNCDQAVQKRAESKAKNAPKNGTFKIIAIVAVVIIAVVACALVMSSSKIDPTEYLTVSFEGLNGDGKVNVEPFEKGIIEEIIGKEPNEFDFKAYSEWLQKYEEYESCIEYSIDKEDGLSNGDKITIDITVTGNLASKVKSSSNTFEVSGLISAEAVDVFGAYTFKFDGVSGFGSLNQECSSDDPYINAVTVKADKYDNLKNGDVVTLTVEVDNETATKYQCVPAEKTKTITISGLSEYLNDTSKISKEIIDSISSTFLKNMQADAMNDMGLSDKNFKYEGAYFLTTKDTEDYKNYNKLVFCVSFDRFNNGELHSKHCMTLEFDNLIADTSGNVKLVSYGWGTTETIELAYENGETFSRGNTISDVVSGFEETYTVVKIS